MSWGGQIRIYYAHQRGVYFVIEQPMTSVTLAAMIKHVIFKTLGYTFTFVYRPVQGPFYMEAGANVDAMVQCQDT